MNGWHLYLRDISVPGADAKLSQALAQHLGSKVGACLSESATHICIASSEVGCACCMHYLTIRQALARHVGSEVGVCMHVRSAMGAGQQEAACLFGECASSLDGAA